MKDLKTLVNELESPDPGVRRAALVGLANTRIPQAFPHLVRAASEEADPSIRALAAKAVEGFRKLGLGDDAEDSGPIEPTVTMIASPDGGVLEKVRAFLSDKDPAVRIKASLACVRLNDPGTLRMLLAAFLREADGSVRARMVQGLMSSLGADEIEAQVLPAVRGGAKALQAAALESIGSSGRSDLAAFALAFAADSDPIVRTRAKAAIKRVGQGSCVAALVTMARSESPQTRTAAALALSQVPLRESVELLKNLVSDEDETVRKAAVDTVVSLAGEGNPQAMVLARELGMAESSGPEVGREILEALASDSSYERAAAARRIAAERPGSALRAVVERLGVEDEELVCVELLDAAGKIGNPEIIPAVRQYLGHMKTALRAGAVSALSSCACPEAFPLVALALHDPDPKVRGRAVVGIRPYGHIEVEFYLREMLLSDDGAMRREAVSVILEIADDDLLGVLDQRALRKDKEYLESTAEALRPLEGAGSTRAASIRNRLLGRISELNSLVGSGLPDNEISGSTAVRSPKGRPAIGKGSSWTIGGAVTERARASAPEADDELGDIFAEYDPDEIAAASAFAKSDGPGARGRDSVARGGSSVAKGGSPGAGPASADQPTSTAPPSSGQPVPTAPPSSGRGGKKPAPTDPRLETMRLLKAYDKTAEAKRPGWIDQTADAGGAAGYNALLAISETETDDRLRSLARESLKGFAGHGFTDFGIRPAGAATQPRGGPSGDDGARSTGESGDSAAQGRGDRSHVTRPDETAVQGAGQSSRGLTDTPAGPGGPDREPGLSPKVTTLHYEGRKSLSTLQDGLKEREKMYNVRSYWDGSFPRSQFLLNSLREDTQEMIGRAMPPNEKPKWACFCFCNREIRDFTSGLKSPDGPSAEKPMNLEAVASALSSGQADSQIDPAFAALFAEVRKPKYLLLIQTRNYLVFFLRSNLTEKLSGFFHVPLEGLKKFRLEFKDERADAHLTLPGGSLTIPELSVDDAYVLEESLKGLLNE